MSAAVAASASAAPDVVVPVHAVPVPGGHEAGRSEPAPVRGVGSAQHRHLRVVELRRRRRRVSLLAAASLAIVFAMVFAVVGIQAQLISGQRRLDALQVQVATELIDMSRRRADVAWFESPAYVVPEAERRLGMQRPASLTFLTPAAGDAVAVQMAAVSGPETVPSDIPSWPEMKAVIAGAPEVAG